MAMPPKARPGPQRPAVFLDRDGVINALIYHRDAGVIDSPFTLRQFRMLPRVPQAIRLLNDLGLAVVVVSNQPGFAKGHFGPELLEQCDRKLATALARVGAHIDRTCYCLHHPDAIIRKLRRRCSCRKPAIGMLTRAARELGVSLAFSYMIGDGISDMRAGWRAGCRTIFVGTWKCEHCRLFHGLFRPTLVARDLWQAAELIREDLRRLPGSCRQPGPPLQAQSAAGTAAASHM